MRFTMIYGVVHDVLLNAASSNGVTGQDLRLLLAMAEQDGTVEGASHELAATFGSNSTAIRRSALALRSAGLVTSRSRRGIGMRLALTGPGHELAAGMLEEIQAALDGPLSVAA